MYIYDPFQHCCGSMNEHLDPECNIDELPLIEYKPDVRSYSFIIRYDDCKSYGVRQRLFYCPWCGKKLPETLGDEWERLLRKEYNLTINDFFNKNGKWDESRIPEEFRTDEWWKKRGL